MLTYLESVDSTNTYCKGKAGEWADFDAVYTLHQTGGLGRRGRGWSASRGKTLALSVVLRSAIIQDMEILPLLCAIATTRALEQLTGEPVWIKWPNDVLMGKKKLVGILCEGTVRGESASAVCGIGVNLLEEPGEFAALGLEHAVSVYEHTGLRLDPKEVAGRLVAELRRVWEEYRKAGAFAPFLDEYAAKCVTLGKRVRVLADGEEREAESIGLSATGGLLVRMDGGTREIRSGEASVRGLYGYV